MRHDTLNVNLWGGPQVGKTEVASYLLSMLKRAGITCALVQDYASELASQGRLPETEPFLITSEQFRRQARLQGQFQVVIADSGIAATLLRAPESYRKCLAETVAALSSGWRQFDYVIGRDLTCTSGGVSSAEGLKDAIAQHEHLRAFARKWSPSIHEELHPDDAPEAIFADILCSLDIEAQDRL